VRETCWFIKRGDANCACRRCIDLNPYVIEHEAPLSSRASLLERIESLRAALTDIYLARRFPAEVLRDMADRALKQDDELNPDQTSKLEPTQSYPPSP
jgi:hypothetical protein